MWSLLVEIALADEWYRVFIVERRVGLAACVCLVYLICELFVYISWYLSWGQSHTKILLGSFLDILYIKLPSRSSLLQQQWITRQLSC